MELLLATGRALGLAQPAPDERAFGDRDVEAARILAAYVTAGVPADAVLEATRVAGRGLARVSAAGAGLLERVELESVATAGGPLPDASLLEYALLLHAREELRRRVASRARIEQRDPRVRDVVATDEVREDTRREGWRRFGTHTVKGLTEPVEVHRLRRAGSRRT